MSQVWKCVRPLSLLTLEGLDTSLTHRAVATNRPRKPIKQPITNNAPNQGQLTKSRSQENRDNTAVAAAPNRRAQSKTCRYHAGRVRVKVSTYSHPDSKLFVLCGSFLTEASGTALYLLWPTYFQRIRWLCRS